MPGNVDERVTLIGEGAVACGYKCLYERPRMDSK